MRWHDDDTFSVLDAKDQPIGWGETKEGGAERCPLHTDERRPSGRQKGMTL